MPKRRTEVALTDDEIQAILDEGRTIQLATNGPNGFPHLVAMWYSVIDGDIYFNTYGTSQKIMNLRRDPRITAMVELGETYGELRGVVLQGTATIIDDPAEKERIGALVAPLNAARYNPGATPSAGAGRISPKRLFVVIHPTSSYSWDHRKLAAGVH